MLPARGRGRDGGRARRARPLGPTLAPPDAGNSERRPVTGPHGPELRSPVARRLRAMPPSFRGAYRRAQGGTSLRAAVTAFCGECCGYDREAVRACVALACPLWRYRPWQRKAGAATEANRDGERDDNGTVEEPAS